MIYTRVPQGLYRGEKSRTAEEDMEKNMEHEMNIGDLRNPQGFGFLDQPLSPERTAKLMQSMAKMLADSAWISMGRRILKTPA